MSTQPIDKGRIAVIAERYQTKNIDQQTGQPIMKCRYATVGRATKWLTNGVEQIEQEIDCMSVSANGPVKLYIFWDSQQNTQQQGAGQNMPQNQSQHYQQPHQQTYAQQRG